MRAYTSIDFMQVVQETTWLDWKIVQNLMTVLDSLWPESLFTARDNLSSKDIDKKISNFLDVTYSDDHLKLLQVTAQ